MEFKKEHIRDLIDDYLDGELSVERQGVFQQSIRNSPDFRQDLHFQRRLDEPSRGAMNDPERTRLKELFQGEEQKIQHRKKSRFRLAIAATVLILVAMTTIFFYYMGPTSDPYAWKMEAIELWSSPIGTETMGATTDGQQQLGQDCLARYQLKEFPAAISCYSAVLAEEGYQANVEALRYSGHAHFQLGDYALAYQQFNQALKSPELNSEEVQLQLEWNRALSQSLIEEGAYKQAVESIANNEDHIYQNEAIQLMKILP